MTVPLELLAGAAVVQLDLAGRAQPGLVEHLVDVLLLRAVEDRRRHRHAGLAGSAELDDLLVAVAPDLASICSP